MTDSKKLPSAKNVQKLAVSEIFGPTFQGEGPSTGRACLFLRLAGCNQACTWCDTPYTWDWARYDKKAEVTKMAPFEVSEKLQALAQGGVNRLVISGGEPLLQQKALLPLLRWLKFHDWVVEVETAGSIVPAPTFSCLVDQFNVSPKLRNSGNAPEVRYNAEALRELKLFWADFKFVMCEPTDLAEIRRILDDIDIPSKRVWLMPEGRTEEELKAKARQVAEIALKHGYNFTHRLHVVLYGDKRGV